MNAAMRKIHVPVVLVAALIISGYSGYVSFKEAANISIRLEEADGFSRIPPSFVKEAKTVGRNFSIGYRNNGDDSEETIRGKSKERKRDAGNSDGSNRVWQLEKSRLSAENPTMKSRTSDVNAKKGDQISIPKAAFEISPALSHGAKLATENEESPNKTIKVGSKVAEKPSSLSALSKQSTSLANKTKVGATSNGGSISTVKGTEWWHDHVDSVSRAYLSRPATTESWCIPKEKGTESQLPEGPLDGFIFVKLHKASSTTCQGVALTIAHNLARRLTNSSKDESQKVCACHTRHKIGSSGRHAERTSRSLMWTFVRMPSSRDLSELYHFAVSRKGAKSDDNNLIQRMRSEMRGKQTRYLAHRVGIHNRTWMGMSSQKKLDPKDIASVVKADIFDRFDFLGVTERMDESLALMTILWGLHVKDVIVLSSKQSGGYDDGSFQKKCFKIRKAERTPAIQEYFEGNDYKKGNPDLLLYDAALRSLDKTIDTVGRERVDTRVREIRKLRGIAEEQCHSEAVFPCSASGKTQFEASAKSCFVKDAGCGHTCIERTLD